MKLKTIATFAPSFVVLTALFLLWESIVKITNISSNLLPPPTLILTAFINNADILATHTIQTSLEAVIGIICAILLGVITAFLLDTSSWIRKTLYPLLITSQTIPIIALAPLLLIWFGFDLLPKVILVTLYCFFPIAIATTGGLASIDRELLHLFKTMNASYWQTLYLVRIPAALPSFFSGLKIAVTYSITGAMVGEYVGAYQGLGVLIQTAANALAIPLVFASIFITAGISLILFGIVIIIEHLAMPWYFNKQV